MRYLLLVLCIWPTTINFSLENYKSIQIKDFKITKCNNKYYPVSVSNVTLHLSEKRKVVVSGSMASEVDLIGPVQASVYIKRNIWGIWIPVPCEDKIGSCTYKNLCDYGIPKNATCPEIFSKNDVPCRCPINKGNYTIPPTFDINLKNSKSILTGTYKGTIEAFI